MEKIVKKLFCFLKFPLFIEWPLYIYKQNILKLKHEIKNDEPWTNHERV